MSFAITPAFTSAGRTVQYKNGARKADTPAFSKEAGILESIHTEAPDSRLLPSSISAALLDVSTVTKPTVTHMKLLSIYSAVYVRADMALMM